MAVLMSLGGNPAGDGFLVAPLGTTYEGELALWTDAGNAAVTLRADPMHNTAHPLRNIYTFRGLDSGEPVRGLFVVIVLTWGVTHLNGNNRVSDSTGK